MSNLISKIIDTRDRIPVSTVEFQTNFDSKLKKKREKSKEQKYHEVYFLLFTTILNFPPVNSPEIAAMRDKSRRIGVSLVKGGEIRFRVN